MTEEYQLKIKTNDRFVGAGTDYTVTVKITGEGGNTSDWHNLDYFFLNDFQAGSLQEYKVTAKGKKIGNPLILHFKLTGFGWTETKKSWLCDYVDVEYDNSPFKFPMYKWVADSEVSVTRGMAMLPQNVASPQVEVMRSREIEENRAKLQWNPPPSSDSDLGWGMCRNLYYDESGGLPLLFSKTVGQQQRGTTSLLEIAILSGSNIFNAAKTINIQELDDYKQIYLTAKYKNPPNIDVWKTDADFGSQILTGISPTAFQKCTELPTYCKVTNEMVSKFLKEGETLESEMKNGKVYISDYSYIAGLKRNKIPLTTEDFQCPNCIGIFYVNKAGDFLPIAIQMEPNDAENIFTPADEEYEWLLAKMYFQVACTCMHEWIYHFLLTHCMSETFSVSMFRNFPLSHPLYKLLRPHLLSVVNINDGGRKVLLPPNGLANGILSINSLDTCRWFFKNMDMTELDIPKNLASKGLLDKELLPNYYYRDDALLIWDALNTYVSGVVKYFYINDEDVTGDFELQAWVADLTNNGFAWQDKNKRGFPEKITSVDQLINLCNIIIFTSSAQHAAVNFGQFQTHQFVPSAPPCMTLPPPQKGKDKVDLERILRSLPGPLLSFSIVSFVYALSEYSKDEVFLGQFVENLFVENAILQLQLEFKTKLHELQLQFDARNATMSIPYWYLLPDKIPVDINI